MSSHKRHCVSSDSMCDESGPVASVSTPVSVPVSLSSKRPYDTTIEIHETKTCEQINFQTALDYIFIESVMNQRLIRLKIEMMNENQPVAKSGELDLINSRIDKLKASLWDMVSPLFVKKLQLPFEMEDRMNQLNEGIVKMQKYYKRIEML